MNYNENDEKHLQAAIRAFPVFIRRYFEDNMQLAVSTKISYAEDFKYFFVWLVNSKIYKNKDVSDISMDDINNLEESHLQSYLYHLHLEKKKTLHRKIYALRSLLKYLLFTQGEDGGYLLKNNGLIKVLSIQKGRSTVRNKEQTIKIHSEMSDFVGYIYSGYVPKDMRDARFYEKNRLRDAAVVSLISDSGIRASEIIKLNIDDIQVNTNIVTVWRSSDRGEMRQVGLIYGEIAQKYIKEYLGSLRVKLDKKAPLFTSNSNYVSGKRLSRRTIANIITKYANAYGEHFTANKIRQGFVLSYLKKNTLSISEQQLGLAVTDLIGKYKIMVE
ncbi:hypothetical protein FE782_09290 [Paenibacillus antri]|uniref:Integrase n=1 Tax=Paenibacillus antri TaxID=2582848 RepID=A0A5R9GLS7_9BACL|nr:tyrosine-type recombinase/integrase [Paenibacillus antri]TLS52805.1 hypothetical protein FE782_09290 [Paenibacillus antri]